MTSQCNDVVFRTWQALTLVPPLLVVLCSNSLVHMLFVAQVIDLCLHYPCSTCSEFLLSLCDGISSLVQLMIYDLAQSSRQHQKVSPRFSLVQQPLAQC